MHDRKLGFNYAEETVNQIGADVGGVFTTTTTVSARHFREPHIQIYYYILARDVPMNVMTARIPFAAMRLPPKP